MHLEMELEIKRKLKKAFGRFEMVVFFLVLGSILVFGTDSFFDLVGTVYTFLDEYLWGPFAFILTFILAFWAGGILLVFSIFLALLSAGVIDFIVIKPVKRIFNNRGL